MSTTFPLHTESFMLLDSGCLTNSDYFTFCFDRCFNYFFRNAAPTNHSFLAMDQAMILGMKDTRVPHLKKASLLCKKTIIL